jgi:hypothetical protein
MANQLEKPVTGWANVWPWFAAAAVLLPAAFALRWQGRLWWCSCGRASLWAGDVWSSHNSQHLADPYSFTHILHGILFCGLLAWAIPRVPRTWRFALAIAIEALWEIIENTDFVIERYREATVAMGYQGDTVANSLSDVAFCAIGFWLARYLELRRSIAVFVAVELATLIWIRDSFVLNVLMLVCPIDSINGAIKSWQMGQ